MLNWYAIYVKSNREQKLAQYLESMGVEVYCPVQTELRQWSDRKKKVQVPLFKSYLFIRIDYTSNYLEVLQSPGAVAFVKWLGKPAVIRDEEIEEIRNFLNEYEDVDAQDVRAFRQGERVQIEYGPFHGNYGEVVREKSQRVVLQIEQLGMILSAEVPKSHVGRRKMGV